MYVFLGVFWGIAEWTGCEGWGCRIWSLRRVSWVAAAGGEHSRALHALNIWPSLASLEARLIWSSSNRSCPRTCPLGILRPSFSYVLTEESGISCTKESHWPAKNRANLKSIFCLVLMHLSCADRALSSMLGNKARVISAPKIPVICRAFVQSNAIVFQNWYCINISHSNPCFLYYALRGAR